MRRGDEAARRGRLCEWGGGETLLRTRHVEMDRVPSHLEGLPHVAQLDVREAADERVVAWVARVGHRLLAARVEHDVATVAVERRHRVALDDDVTREQAHLGAQLDGLARVVARLAEVIVLQGRVEAHAVVGVGSAHHDALLGLVHVEAARRDDELRADGPVDGLREAHRRRPRRRRRVEPRPRAARGLAVQVERAAAAGEHLGAVERQLGRDGRAVQRDLRLLQEGRFGGADGEGAAHDEDEGGVELQVDTRKAQVALHDEEVEARRRDIHDDRLPLGYEDGVALDGHGHAAPREQIRPVVDVLEGGGVGGGGGGAKGAHM